MARDPRAGAPMQDDVRPLVAQPSASAPVWLMGAGIAGAALALFLLLDGHRRAAEAPAVRASAATRAAAAGPPAPPLLYLPPMPVAAPAEAAPPAPAAPPTLPAPPAAPRVVYVPQPAPSAPTPSFAAPPPPERPARSEAGALVIDATLGDENPGGSGGDTGGSASGIGAGLGSATTAAPGARARATVLADRGTTVPQGTVIPAVLETAFDSTRPGLARALVSQDVRGFDGSRVLIPRGSRLTGEYRSDVASGQHRALIVWTRLVRPDGAAIAIASPAADTLGRAGVKGHLNSHFLARFTGAILQTALAVGVNLASRPAAGSGTVVLGLPGSNVGGNFGFGQGSQTVNTLTVRAGTSIGVLVSRDLDFADVEGRG